MKDKLDPKPVEARDLSKTFWSMISIDDGECSKISLTASLAPKISRKCTTDNDVIVGQGTKLILTSVTVQRVPSEPTTIFVRLKEESVINSSRLYPLTRLIIFG